MLKGKVDVNIKDIFKFGNFTSENVKQAFDLDVSAKVMRILVTDQAFKDFNYDGIEGVGTDAYNAAGLFVKNIESFVAHAKMLGEDPVTLIADLRENINIGSFTDRSVSGKIRQGINKGILRDLIHKQHGLVMGQLEYLRGEPFTNHNKESKLVDRLFNLNEAMNIMHGKKGVLEGVNSLLKNTVAAYSGTQRVYNNLTKATKKRVQDSRRRQSQFLNAYFPDYRPVVDANDALTRNSPYYEDIRNVFWLDTPKEKAHAYYTALNYLTHVIQRQDMALAKNEAGARSEAKKRIRNILSRIRPIPASWRKRGKGERTTKYRLYKSKLTPEQIREEMELDKLYKEKKLEFWRAVAQYR